MSVLSEPLRVGTRGSRLAKAQTRLVMAQLQQAHPGLVWEEVLITTEGDRFEGALHTAPTPGIFVSALRDALLAGEVDCVVHSMKDLPAADHAEITLGAVPRREDPVDVLVSTDHQPLTNIPAGSRIGTSSPRRAASIRRARPDLDIADIRGNITTRLEKVQRGDYQATVLAKAGLIRAGLTESISHELDIEHFLPAPRQGILAIETRSDDVHTALVLRALDDEPTRQIAATEQGILLGLEAGCHSAVSALAHIAEGTVYLRAELADPDTGEVERVEAHTGRDRPKVLRAWSTELAASLKATELARRVGLS